MPSDVRGLPPIYQPQTILACSGDLELVAEPHVAGYGLGRSTDIVGDLIDVVACGAAEYRLISTDIAAVPRPMLGAWLASVEDQRTVIVNAIDFLLQGF